MSPLAQHMMMRLVDGRVIARTEADRRIVAAVVTELGRPYGLLCFCVADTHLHLLVACSRQEAALLSRRIKITLAYRLHLEVGFAQTHYVPIESQRHLERAFTYILDQDRHHGCFVDPCHDASVLPDLLGLRVNGAYVAQNVRMWLPRVNRDLLVRYLGVDLEDSGAPVDSWEHLATAAAAALALPDLSGRLDRVVRARRAAVQVVGAALSTKDIARRLGISERAVKRARQGEVDGRLLMAVRRQLRLRQRVVKRCGAKTAEEWSTHRSGAQGSGSTTACAGSGRGS